MSAALCIHVLEGDVTEKDIAQFNSSTIGSKYYSGAIVSNEKYSELCNKMLDTPNIEVGEVSWLKAALYEDYETYVPTAIEKIVEIIGEDLPVITDEFIGRIGAAFDEENSTMYSIADPIPVIDFLKEHKGKQVFTISW